MASTQDEIQPRYTVSSLTASVKGLLEHNYGKIFVDGEISGWRVYPSGHAYFTLKDAEAQISCVMFASVLNVCRSRDRLRDGAKVLLRGKVTVYAPRGNYQLVVTGARLEGEGDLMRRYLELKARLEAEGLFDASRKRPLPAMPRRIGIVTSEAGAVIHDMCTVLTRRFPNLEIRLYPSLVQGDGASQTLARGVRYFNSCEDWRADILIIGRGGGSFEDLFCFNDETLVRALAASEIPTISAVGHETDFTLCDFAADKRAGTPSMAAELAVPVLDELCQRIEQRNAQLVQLLNGKGEFFAQRVDQLSDALSASLTIAAGNAERRLADALPRLGNSLQMRLQREQSRFEKAEAKLTAYSPYGVLDRGYSLTTREDGTVVRDADALAAGDVLVTRLAHGSVRSTFVEKCG